MHDSLRRNVAVISLIVAAVAQAQPTTASAVTNANVAMTVGPNGIQSLKHPGDAFDTDYVAADRAIGGLVIASRVPGGAWQTTRTATLTPEFRQINSDPAKAAWESVVRAGGLEIVQQFALADTGTTWSFTLKNTGQSAIEVGDLAITTPFNTHFGSNANSAQTTSLDAHRRVLTQRQIPHWWVAGSGSFIFLARPNGVGPFLVMMPTGDTRLEMFDDDARPAASTTAADRERRPDRLFFIHSAATAERLAKQTADWQQKNGTTRIAPATRLGHTSATLQPGAQLSYGFKFRFTPEKAPTPYAGVRQVLYEENGYDITSAPGMTVPSDLTTTVAIRTKNTIDALAPEFPDRTKITEVPAPSTAPSGTRLFRINFKKLGENTLTIRSGGHSTTMEFFVTEPLETLINKRAAFLVSHSQWTKTGKWYDGVFTEWDAVKQVLRSPDDRDGLFKYILTCDDPGLGKAPFLASKNAVLPVQGEVSALDDYIRRFVWGGLQMTDKERHPYAIYGIDNWYANRNSTDPGPKGQDHVWRIYDYPHIVLLYYRMHQIASFYPGIKTELKADEYLTRAYRTAMAYFEVPTKVEGWSAYDTGTYNELIIPDLIDTLNAANRREEAEKLRAHWEQKVKAFVFAEDPYLYGSEYAFDSTTFEASAALAKWAVERMATPGYVAPPALPAVSIKGEPPKTPDAYPAVTAKAAADFMERQIAQNVSDRGWLQNCYYYQGSDFRGGFGAGYLLSYMSQMGGWGVLDYALNQAADPVPLMRLGYASTLSSWALVNSGTPESDYGYCFPGKNNDGAAAGGFEPRPFARQWIGKTVPRGSWYYANEIDLGFSGGLRSAATIVADDPVFGPIAYGGELTATDTGYRVIPRDGLRQRLHLLLGGRRVSLELTQDAFAADVPIEIDRTGTRVRFTLENRTSPAHHTTLRIKGATADVTLDGQPARTTPGTAGVSETSLPLTTDARPTVTVSLPRQN